VNIDTIPFKIGDKVKSNELSDYMGIICGHVKGISTNPLSEHPIEVTVLWNDDVFGNLTDEKNPKVVHFHPDELIKV
jgi:hypothetical protein